MLYSSTVEQTVLKLEPWQSSHMSILIKLPAFFAFKLKHNYKENSPRLLPKSLQHVRDKELEKYYCAC